MEKTIGAFEARRQFGKILQEVTARNDKYVIERHGEPVAALVPIAVYEQMKRERTAFFERARAIAAEVNLSPEEAEALVAEAIAAVRAETAL